MLTLHCLLVTFMYCSTVSNASSIVVCTMGSYHNSKMISHNNIRYTLRCSKVKSSLLQVDNLECKVYKILVSKLEYSNKLLVNV